jgi:hypothetical protein
MAKNTKKRLRNVDKVAEILGGTVESFSDKSATWVNIENKKFSLNIQFDGTGKEFEKITISEKVYAVVDEKVIATIRIK